MPRVIYKQAFSSFWLSFAMALFLAAGGTWIELSNGKPWIEALKLGVPVGLGVTAVAYAMTWVMTRKTVAVLATDGSTLTGRWQTPLGPGRSFLVPIKEIEKWRWFDANRKVQTVIAVLEFSHRGSVYRVPALGARKLDLTEFRLLAPAVVSDAVVHTSATLVGQSKGAE